MGLLKPLLEGISVDRVQGRASRVEFLYDLTYEKDGEIVNDQRIFRKVLDLIREAEEFIIIDMFLFNDAYNREDSFPGLTAKLTGALIDAKSANPDFKIYFITDEINIRDSNPLYSGGWRAFLQWFGTSGRGWLPNAFSQDSPKVTLRSYLRLLNFKANHRKVAVTEKKPW